jgi:hypothetical protein
MSEHTEQAAFFEWCNVNSLRHPELTYFYAIPNGGKRSIGTAVKLRAEGVKSGVLDTHLPVKRGAFIGLWIEFKVGHNALTPAQMRWSAWLKQHGHYVDVCYTWERAAEVTLEYLALDSDV